MFNRGSVLNVGALDPIKHNLFNASVPLAVAASSGWSNDFNGVSNASISKINGVAIASIAKVNGVE